MEGFGACTWIICKHPRFAFLPIGGSDVEGWSLSEIDYRKRTLRNEGARKLNLRRLISDRVVASSKGMISTEDVHFSVDSRGELRKMAA